MGIKNSTLFFAMFLITGTILAQPPDTLWTKWLDCGGFSDAGNSVAQTMDGGFILAGSGAGVAWLIKTNEFGDTTWTRQFDGLGIAEGRMVQQTPDDGFIMLGTTYEFGSDNRDFLLIKTDATGDTIWTNIFGTEAADWGYSIDQTNDGGYIIAGSTGDPYYYSGAKDVLLARCSPNGDTLWTRTYGGDGRDYGYCVQQTSPDNDFIIAGMTNSFGAGLTDVYLIKTNSQGDTLWTATFGGSEPDGAYSVCQTEDGSYIIGGGTKSFGTGYGDFYLVKTDAMGDSVWTNNFAGQLAECWCVQQTNDGGYLMAGSNRLGSNSNNGFFLKTNNSGLQEWQLSIDGPYGNNDIIYSVYQTNDEGYIACGMVYTGSASAWDIWLIRLDSEAPFVEKFLLSQPHRFVFYPPNPNPFNPTTVLSFELPVASYVKLEVFDINGRSVGARRAAPLPSRSGATPTMYPAGAHQITFDGSGLPSGIYLAKLVAGELQQMQKLVLLK